jgi:hypothetical protein
MFFRRERPKILSFDDHIANARAAGFTTKPMSGGLVWIERDGVAAIAEPGNEDVPRVVERPGIIMSREIGTLTDEGFQKFFTTASGKRKPALASELKAIQNFQEDLRQALHLVSLYNESLGTVSNVYVYDRVEGRDVGRHDKPWQAESREPIKAT